MNKRKRMFSLWITQRSHLFVIEKMVRLIDFEQILTSFLSGLECIMDSHPGKKAHNFLANVSILTSLKLPKQSIYVLTQKWADKG